MKQFIYFILLVLSSNFSSGQNRSNLDSKFGINKFKLESSYELYQSKLKYDFDGNDKVKYYLYTGGDIRELFGTEVNRIGLGFYKGKLYTISYSFNPATEFHETIIFNKLKDLFGVPAIGNDNKVGLDYQWAYIWQTNKTFLQHSKYSATSNYHANYLDIFMYSKKLKHQIDNDNF